MLKDTQQEEEPDILIKSYVLCILSIWVKKKKKKDKIELIWSSFI